MLTRSKTIFRPGGVYTTSRGWTGITLELTTNTVTQYVQEGAQTISQQSTIHRKYHGNTGTYAGTLMRELRNSQERESREQQTDETDRRVADDDVTAESHKSIVQTSRTNEVTQNMLTSRPRVE